MLKKGIVIAIMFTIIMIGSAFAISIVSDDGLNQSTSVSSGNSLSSNVEPLTNVQPFTSSSNTPWTMPTTTQEEPGYTNGTFICGTSSNPATVNYFSANTVMCAEWYNMIYSPLLMELPNGTVVPWLASSYNIQKESGKTFDVETNSTQNYTYVINLNLRHNVKWSDWSTANNSQTYCFSNTVDYHYDGSKYCDSHTYSSFAPTKMKKYYLQSGDVVLTWRLDSPLEKDWQNIVNAIPNGNLSVKLFVSNLTLLTTTVGLGGSILPYNVWIHHDFTTVSGLYNCSKTNKAGQGYYSWTEGWNTATGSVPDMVGDGPFMVSNNFGFPEGSITPDHGYKFYENPYFFGQYTNKSDFTTLSSGKVLFTPSIREYTPKIFEVYQEYYSSASSVVAAYDKGEIDAMGSVAPTFLPQVESAPGSSIYHKPSYGYSQFRIDSGGPGPLNITAFRQALNYAFPYDYVASTIDDGYGLPSSDSVGPTNVLYYNSSAPSYSFNLKEAQKLIASIPGMDNTSSGLYYNGKPVCISIQSSTSAKSPTGVDAIEAYQKELSVLGIKSVIKEEAFTTLTANVVHTQESYNFTTNKDTVNDYQLASSGCVNLPYGDVATCCELRYNNVLGTKDFSFFGPFTSMDYNGKQMTGIQVQNLLNKLIYADVATDSIQTSIHLTKEIQTIVIDEAVNVIEGYSEDIVPELTLQFTNYSHTNTLPLYLYWAWQFLSVYEHSTSKVSQKYKLNVNMKSENGLTFYSHSYGNITLTVLNGTTPVKGADVSIGLNAPYGGIENVTSNSLVTNSQGKATWEFETAENLSDSLVTCNSTTNKVIHVNEANATIIAYASIPGQPDVAPSAGYFNVTLHVGNKPKPVVNYEYYYIIGGVVAAVVIIGGAVFGIKRSKNRKT
jgi:ABC-type transport system substrate-binding protein